MLLGTKSGSLGSKFGCAVKGARHQRVEVPPEELSMRLGSHRAVKRGNPLSRSPEEEGP